MKRVANTKWDMVIDLRNSAVSRLIRARRRYVLGGHINKDRHKVEQAAQIMELNHIPAPTLYFTDAQKEFAKNLMPDGTPVLGVGPSANWIGKTWPTDRFIEIVKWITSPDGILPNARVAVFAAPGEEEQAQPVLESVPEDKRIDCIAKGDPGEAAAALSRCDFYIGNDSGLMHAAAAAKVPTVGLFGPSYPHWYRPWGSHTAYVRTPETFDELIDFEGYSAKTLKHSLMVTLDTDEVIQTIKTFWNQQQAA